MMRRRSIVPPWLCFPLLLLSASFVQARLASGEEPPPLPPGSHLGPEVRSRLAEAAQDSKLRPWQREFMLKAARGMEGGATPSSTPTGLSLPPAGIASVDGDWSSIIEPGERGYASAIYDPVRDRMIVFGGVTAVGDRYNDVWTLSLTGNPAWSNLAPAGTPPTARLAHAAIYDPVRDRIVVFGGYDGSAAPYCNDVWALSLAGSPAWSELVPSGSQPPGRYQHTAIYDPLRDRVVVFGGLDGTAAPRNDVWSLSLAGSPAWSEILPSGSLPSARSAHTAIHDPVRDRMVVFGGGSGTAPYYLNDVWALSLNGSPAWTELAPAGSTPPARVSHVAIYDGLRDRIVVFGGSKGTAPYYLNDVWSLSLSGSPAWSELAPTGSPPAARIGHAALYDPLRDRMVVFAGYVYSYMRDTHALSLAGSTAWSVLAYPWSLPTAGTPYVGIYDSLRERLVVYGGDNDVWALWLSGSPRWTAYLPSGTPPSSRDTYSAVYDPVRDRMLLFGGASNFPIGEMFNEVWALSLAGNPAWSEVVPSSIRPPPGIGHAAIYDPVRDRMVVFGGFDNNPPYVHNDVWGLSLAGTPVWTNLAPAGSPPSGGYGATAFYDALRDRMVVFGGADATFNPRNDVSALALAGSPTWSALAPAGSAPTARYFHSAVYDPSRDRMVAFGGYDNSGYRNDVWALSLAGSLAWSALTPVGGPPVGRYGSPTIFDPDRDRMVVFAGYDGSGYRNDVWLLRNDTTSPTVQVLVPNGGEALDNSSSIPITWIADDNLHVDHVDLYFSANGGSAYSLLAAGEANDESYAWSGATLTTHGRVLIEAFDSSGNVVADASDGDFSISDPAPPAIPAPFAGVFTGAPVQLHWGANTEGDFASYRLHRGSTAGFVPGPGNLVVSQADTGFVDAGSTWSYYKLSAVDANGHESGFALVTPAALATGATPTGDSVAVSLGSNMQLTFQHVTGGGQSQITLQTGGSPPPNGLRLAPSSPPLYYVVTTTATFTDSVMICVTYDPAHVNGPEANLRLMHFDTALMPAAWVPVTRSLNTADNVICGKVAHFSEFALMEIDPSVPVIEGTPLGFRLYPCTPNPVSSRALIRYDLSAASPVSLGLFDLQGRLVRELERRPTTSAGRYVVAWDGRGDRGEPVHAGIYFLRLDAGSFHGVQRVVVMK